MAEAVENFDYKAGRKASEPRGNNKAEFSWTASEYIEHSRGASWYLILVVGTAALSALLYLITKDIFATVITLVLGAIVASVAHRKPRQITYQLDASGLSAGEKFYDYHQFRSYSVIQEGQLNSLVFSPLKRLLPPVSAYFEAEDADKIVEVLSHHLPLEDRAPDRIDSLSRRLRF